MRFSSLFCLFAIIGSSSLFAQTKLISMDRNGIAEFPFHYVNNFMIVDVVFNENINLKLIFDTGAENTIITNREVTKDLKIDYKRRITLYGADLHTELYAFVAPGIDIKIGSDFSIAQQAVLVLREDYFQFEEYTGVKVHGILGADILRRFVIHIDFKRRMIIFQDPATFKPPRSKAYTPAESEFKRYKPYLYLPTSLRNGNESQYKFLLDTGASLALLMYTANDSSLILPRQLISASIGFGLGGTLEGYVGRTANLKIGKYDLQNVVTNFQNFPESYAFDSTFLNDRNGLVGNVILQRFNLIIDYIHEKIYLKPNRNFKKKFLFDRSGISLAATGNLLNHFVVLNVIKGSPAEEVGIQKGDEIRALNGVPVFFKTLESIVRTFQKKPGKKMQVLIKRGDQRFVVEFRLRDLI